MRFQPHRSFGPRIRLTLRQCECVANKLYSAPGRDRPSACNTEDVEDLRLSAWLYWNKVTDELSRLQHALREAVGVLTEPGMMSVDEWKAWKRRTVIMCWELLGVGQTTSERHQMRNIKGIRQ